MKKVILAISFVVLSMLTMVACNDDNDTPIIKPEPTPENPDNGGTDNGTAADNGISTTIPSGLGSVYNSKNFNRYTKVTTPNGGAVHIVAQDKLTDEQIIRCRSILQHYLTDYKGSVYGSDKSAVANKMAENKAILCLLNGQDDGKNPIGNQVTGQPLWGIGQDSWIKELTAENSLSQEYLASVVDVYYGLWGAFTESATNGMWGFYVGKTREDMKTDDPMGYELMNNKFFPPYLTYNAQISANLNGNFSLKFDASKPYTHHSRYLKDVTLLGKNNNSVTVNEMDNNITGNSGRNTVIFSGKSSEYTVKTDNGVTTVTDKESNRDGKNTLSKIEKLQFTDKTVSL